VTRKNYQHEATELALALRLLLQKVRAAVPSEAHELSLAQIAVIKRLASGGPATTADLARSEGMKAQSMGTIVASLERTGLVERTPHPTDGRQRHIGLTVRGEAIHKSDRKARRTWLAQAIAKLDDAEQKSLPAVTALIKHLAEL